MVNHDFAKQNVNVSNPDNVKVEAVADIRYDMEGRIKGREWGKSTRILML